MMIYFIQQEQTNMVKIGFTSNVKKRLATLQTASAYPLRLLGYCVGGRELEARIHEELALSRVAGEWFNYTEQVYHAIKKYCHSHTAELSNTIFQYQNLVGVLLQEFGGVIRTEASDAILKKINQMNILCDHCLSLYCEWSDDRNEWICHHCTVRM
jgi:hypothetical protein